MNTDRMAARGCMVVVAAASTVTAAAVAVGMRAGAWHGVVAWLLMVAMCAVLWAALLGGDE